MKIALKRPITVGEKTITEVDLSKLEDFTGADILFCRREASAKTGQPIVYGSLDDAYRLEVAAKASGVEIETMTKLWAPDFEMVDGTVKSFLMGLE